MAMAARTLANSTQSSHSLSLVSSINSILQTLIYQNPNSSTPTSTSPLDQFSPHLNPNLVVEIIKSQSNPHSAIFFFRWASNLNPNPNNYTHTQRCYSAMVDLLLSHSMFSTAVSLLEKSNNLRDFIIGKFIKAYGDRGDIRGAIHWLNRAKMIESGRCLYSYNSILGVTVRSNRIELARAFFDQILKEGLVKPDVSTYTVMIRGYCKLGMIKDALEVFDGMICRPNIITYNTIISGLCKKGYMEDARGILDRMLSEGFSPDKVTFTTLVDGYCKKGELEKAENCMEEMGKFNCEPNVFTYNSLIDGFCLRGKIDEAKKLMTKMRLNGLKDDIATHTSLLKGFCIVGRLDEAAKHLKEMVTLGLNPDAKSYGVIVNEYCKTGRPVEAISLLDEMKLRGINPSLSSYNALFRALTDSGEINTAIVVLKKMPKMGLSPNFLSYSTVICSLCRIGGRMREAEELVVEMIRRGHQVDASMYNSMVKGYCEDGESEMAIGMFHEMMENGFVINLESFSVFVKELCGKGKVKEVKKRFEEMCKRCDVPDVDSYRRILNEHQCQLWADFPEYWNSSLCNADSFKY
ncbi:Pentatricopeptide repeat [Macleaya cordata]|uniref:Pentatricopeptide repeat n=1 Tax=Macleaya cordata TaxID=56857 RepID=A0A200QD31_MACCD|nr:Pentatricopeptide repeat [Macleaya cordata]